MTISKTSLAALILTFNLVFTYSFVDSCHASRNVYRLPYIRAVLSNNIAVVFCVSFFIQRYQICFAWLFMKSRHDKIAGMACVRVDDDDDVEVREPDGGWVPVLHHSSRYVCLGLKSPHTEDHYYGNQFQQYRTKYKNLLHYPMTASLYQKVYKYH